MRFALCLLVLAMAAASLPAAAAEPPQTRVISTIAIDFDGDGNMDRADLVQINPEGGDGSVNENQDFFVNASERVDLILTFNAAARRPVFVKRQVVDPEEVLIVSALTSDSKGSISLRSCYGCGAMKSWEQTLTIAYRKGNFVVAGYSRYWEWYSHKSDGSVDGLAGECDINYLTGKGTASHNAENTKPLKTRIKLVRFADWSASKIPKACKFY